MLGSLLLLAASLLVGVESAPQYDYYNYSPKSSRSLFPSNYNPGYSLSYARNDFPSNYNPRYSLSSSRSYGARDLFKDGRSISDMQVMCNDHTCGLGAHCTQGTVRPVCACKPGYSGDPLSQCIKVECVDDSGCDSQKACVNQHCVDPCKDRCGMHATCDVQNHLAVCTCPPGYTGSPGSSCRIFDPEEACHPSPCGINTNCFVKNYLAVCVCLPGYKIGPDSQCRHECESDQECSPHQSCRDFKCVNPCKDCGKNAICETVAAHRAICKCPTDYHGDPYLSCFPECTTDGECPSSKPRCVYNKCMDPCSNHCGVNAMCELNGITPVCSCPRNMTGNPKTLCRPFELRDVCEPDPCAANAKCTLGHDSTGAPKPVCNCLPGFYGVGTGSCERGECELDSQCRDFEACVGFHCIDPCLGNTECGSGGVCMARRHIAVCTCPDGRSDGDALVNCYNTRASAASTRYLSYRTKRNGEQDSKEATAKTSEEKESPEPVNGTTAEKSEAIPTKVDQV